MKDFPNISPQNLQDAIDCIRYILKERSNDIKDFDNLRNIFISGRKVGKVPSGATDISSTDKIGDFNYDANYIYIVVNNAGTAQWRRAALASW